MCMDISCFLAGCPSKSAGMCSTTHIPGNVVSPWSTGALWDGCATLFECHMARPVDWSQWPHLMAC
jgi:hypothetical protein